MKIARFNAGGKIYTGIVENDVVTVIDGNMENPQKTGISFKTENITLLCPVTPSKIVAAGLNYKDHIGEIVDDIPTTPIIFIKPSGSVIGPMEQIVLPEISNRVDYEGELGVVIKKTAKAVKAADANEYILGYTCVNDVTARDLQKQDGQWTRAKSFDTFCPIGPYIVTDISADNLKIKTYLNDKIVQSSNTSMMIFSVAEIIEFISSVMTLYEGDVIATGTPFGVGKMNDGDIVKIEIDKIGTLTNYVGAKTRMV